MERLDLSRHRISDFDLLRPRELDEISELYKAHESWTFMAGGIDLKREMKAGRSVDLLVDLKRLSGIHGVRVEDDMLRIGSAVTHTEIVRTQHVAGAFPDLPTIWSGLGNERVRQVGTVVGNIISGQPTYHGRPVFASLGAKLHVYDGTSEGHLDLAREALSRVMSEQLLVLALEVPIGVRTRCHYISDFSSTRVAVSLTDARIGEYEIAVAVSAPKTLTVDRFSARGTPASGRADEIADAISPHVVWGESSVSPKAQLAPFKRWVRSVLSARIGGFLAGLDGAGQ